MSDAYGICRWTCGECGEIYEAGGVVGDSKVDRWRRGHKEEHRLEKLSPDERLREQIQSAAGQALASGDQENYERLKACLLSLNDSLSVDG